MKTHLADKFPNWLYSGGGGCDFSFPEQSGERFWCRLRSLHIPGGDASCEQVPRGQSQLPAPI